jgi:quinone-modifying oxidoreductase subunit QmoC
LSERAKLGNDIEFIRHLKKHGGDTMKKCFQCATCSVACELSPKEYAFPRKEMINASWGLKDKLMQDPDIWLCHGCMDCSQQCPRGARPGDVMAALRSYVYRHYSVPSFMGKALSDPKYLPALFIVPIILIFILMMMTQDWNLSNIDWSMHKFKYAEFIAHGPIEMLFIAGNVLIFSLAYIGFRRYFKNMSQSFEGQRPQMGFVAAWMQVGIDFMFHKKFSKCPTNSNRHLGHLFVFYGFMGALVATGIVVLDLIFAGKWGIPKFLPEHMDLPLYLFGGFDTGNWAEWVEVIGLATKLIGVAGGLGLIIGGLMLIMKRYSTPENESKSTYNDMLFLWILWLVAFTGMALVFLRLGGLPVIAFPMYFVHMVFVYFLLWYMPFSKFAHMIYRYIGLTFLKMYGRENKPEIFASNKLKQVA